LKIVISGRIQEFGLGDGERFARTNNGGLEAEPPIRGQEALKPPEAERHLLFDAQRMTKFGPLSRISR